jgi:uracil-DNA glycosylase family 4
MSDDAKKSKPCLADYSEKTAAAWALWHYHTLGISHGLTPDFNPVPTSKEPTGQQPPISQDVSCSPTDQMLNPGDSVCRTVQIDAKIDPNPTTAPLSEVGFRAFLPQEDLQKDPLARVSGPELARADLQKRPGLSESGPQQSQGMDAAGSSATTQKRVQSKSQTGGQGILSQRQAPLGAPASGPEVPQEDLQKDGLAPVSGSRQSQIPGASLTATSTAVWTPEFPPGATTGLKTPAEKEGALIQLAEKLRQFKDLPISQTAENMVFSDGNPHSPIMLVGEAPGAEEDRQGKPFVGPSGKLLDAMLASINLDRTRVYITNVVPWRPPFNRQPSGEEIRAFLPFLHQHIAIIQPRVIICVGGVAAKALLNLTQTLTETQGQLLTYYSQFQSVHIPAWTLYHPAYLMRAPGQKKVAWQQLLRIQAFLKKIEISF